MTMATTTAEKSAVSALLSEELMPKGWSPIGQWEQLRAVLMSDISVILARVNSRFYSYPLADDETVLALKLAVIQDATVCAGHLTPAALRVTQYAADSGDWDPKLITARTSDGKVQIQLSDEQTIGECRNEDGEVCFLVGIAPSGGLYFWERYEALNAVTKWGAQNMWWIVLALTWIFILFS